jgi:hypothetical protein
MARTAASDPKKTWTVGVPLASDGAPEDNFGTDVSIGDQARFDDVSLSALPR